MPLEDTLDSVLPGGSVNTKPRTQRVELVRGHGPHITIETTNLLRVRLRGGVVSADRLCRVLPVAIGRAPAVGPARCCSTCDGAVLICVGRLLGVALPALQHFRVQIAAVRVAIFAAPALYLLLVEYQRITDCA